MRTAAIVIAAIAVAGCKPRFVPKVDPGDGASALELVEFYECARCHDTRDRERGCVSCHRAVLAGELDAKYPEESVTAWKKHLVHFTELPSLEAARRLRREWVIAFLQEPIDVRPHLEETMPRFEMNETRARRIAEWIVPSELPETSVSREGGRAVFEAKGCPTCHEANAVKLAPDLRYTRERMTRASIIAWLREPAESMPHIAMTEDERIAIATYLVEAPLAAREVEPMPERLPLLDREVTHAEVEQKIFRRLCRHCHSDPEPVGGDGGPGNTGGLGFRGKGIDLGSRGAILRKRGELFARDEHGVPKLVRVLLARHAEVRGHPVTGMRGMPLAMPPLVIEDIQLIDTWIAKEAL